MKTTFHMLSCLLLIAMSARADVVVDQGYLVIVDGSLSASGDVVVAPDATIHLAEPTTLASQLLHIQLGGVVAGCGFVDSPIYNQGELIANCGDTSTLTIEDSVTNDGAVRVLNGTQLDTGTAAFINNGLFDMIFGFGIPTTFVNNGVFYSDEQLPPLSLELIGNNARLSFMAISQHRYQLFHSPDLSPLPWTPVGEPIIGQDQLLEIDHSMGDSTGFYYYSVID